ncbi:MAG: ThiF family adenylyltransferase [Sideroxyarcus sp.]
MSNAPIALRPDVQRLTSDKYEVSVYKGYLIVSAVPYVTPNRMVAYGTIACAYVETGKPDHTVYFVGATPCNKVGQPLTQMINNSNPATLFDRFVAQHYFSLKPDNRENFPADYYEKITHYVNILGAQARLIDKDADARTGRAVASQNDDSVFRYGDSASARAGIVAVAQKLWLPRIAIIGLGGTGSYILDQIAKTPVKEIHLYDGDTLKPYNAFRSPGAASLEQLQVEPLKVDYFKAMYDPMRTGIVPHPEYVTNANTQNLNGLDFVFVAVDKGPARKLICNFLKSAGMPFIDVGMGLTKIEDSMSVRGNCRATLCTPEKNDHLDVCLDVHDEAAEGIYSNIQVADMNAMNAVLAVMLWKQHFQFYSNSEQAHNLNFSIDLQSLARGAKPSELNA